MFALEATYHTPAIPTAPTNPTVIVSASFATVPAPLPLLSPLDVAAQAASSTAAPLPGGPATISPVQT